MLNFIVLSILVVFFLCFKFRFILEVLFEFADCFLEGFCDIQGYLMGVGEGDVQYGKRFKSYFFEVE